MIGPDPYRLLARLYDLLLEPFNAQLRAVAWRLVEPQPEWTVLDIGCGTGAALAEYAEMGCDVIGVDASPAMVSVARERLGPGVELHDDVTDSIPVADDSMDLVHISLVLHSLRREESVNLLREAERVLRPGGRIVVIDFAVAPVRFPDGWRNRAVAVLAETAAGPTHARNSFGFQRRGGLEPLAAEAGLVVDRRRIVGGGNIVVAVLVPDPEGE